MNPAEFSTLAESEESLWWFRGMRAILYRLLDPYADSVQCAMEAGSGTGHMAGVLARRYGWRIVATELAAEGVARTPRLAGITPVQADIAHCPYADAVFDAVLSLDVLVHFPAGEEKRALAEFGRVLRPQGLLVLRVSALDMLRSRHSEFCGERQRFTRRRLVASVDACGFRVLRCTYANALLLPVALARFRVWEPLRQSPPASGTAPVAGWLDRLLYMPLALEDAWIGRGRNFPLGQSLLLIARKG
jgi:SAM-dependent methyltransferase